MYTSKTIQNELLQSASSLITCQRGSARQCCKSHMHFKGKTYIFDPSYITNYSSYGDGNWHGSLSPGVQQVCQVPSCYLQGFRPHAYVKYKVRVLFFPFFLFSEARAHYRPINRSSWLMAQNACSDVRKCLLGVWSTTKPKWGRGSLKTPNFRPRNANSL